MWLAKNADGTEWAV